MEGDAPQFLVAPAGYINPTTPYYYPQPQITSVNPLPLEIYVSPNGSDDVAVVGSVTAPFQSITAAVLYVEQLTEFATTPIVIFVAPGTYAGGFALSDNMYLIGATVNSSAPAVPFLQSNGIIITSSIDVTASYANDSPIVAQNIQFNAGIQVRSDLFDTSFSLVNCVLRGNGSQPTLNISPFNDIFTTVSARGCEFSTDSIASTAVVRAFVFDKSTLIFDNCQFSTPGGSLIDIIGTLKANNCSFLNTAEDDALPPLIRAVSGSGQIPDVVITNSTFKYTDVTTVDTGGTKLAVEFTAGAQNINAVMTNNTMSIFLGAAQTDIVKNIGAGQVTLSQSANSCLLDGKTIDTTNLVLTTAFFLQDSPLPPPPAGGVSYLNSLEGSVTLAGAGSVSVGTVGSTITITGTVPVVPVDSVGGKTGTVTFDAGDGIAITYGVNNAAPINIANAGVLSVVAGTGITLSGDTPQNPTVSVNLPVYQATYYKSAAQNLVNGSTDITFDSTATWNNDAGYITHTSGLASFTVVQAGLYQLEWNASVLANGATWNTANSKVISIDITRSPTAEQIVIGQTAVTATTQDYTQSLCSTFYLEAGDVINCRIQGNFSSAIPTAAGLLNTFDLGTWFSWRYVAAGGAVAYQNPPPVIQAAGTTALTTVNANTTYILTSGATQNFTTAGLGAGNAGLVWFVKNASAADINIQAGGVAIAGVTDVLHTKRIDTNTPAQYLYWSGTTLTMY